MADAIRQPPQLRHRWRESFAREYQRARRAGELPSRVQLPKPGKRTHREELLLASVELAAIAKPDGRLSGKDSFYGERQLASFLGLSLNTARGLLGWFEDHGWLQVYETDSKRSAHKRYLAIPVEEAPTGWPVVEGYPMNSNGHHHPDDPDVGHPARVDGHPLRDEGHSAQVDGHRPNGTGDHPPGEDPVNPDVPGLPGTARARAEAAADAGQAVEELTGDDTVDVHLVARSFCHRRRIRYDRATVDAWVVAGYCDGWRLVDALEAVHRRAAIRAGARLIGRGTDHEDVEYPPDFRITSLAYFAAAVPEFLNSESTPVPECPRCGCEYLTNLEGEVLQCQACGGCWTAEDEHAAVAAAR